MLKLRGVGLRATVSLRRQIHNYYRAQNLSTLQAHQIDGLFHRAGKFAQVYWVVAKDTVDCRVAEILRKLESMGNLQGDSTKDFEEILSAIQRQSA
jgi:hypothetical protein